MKRRHVSERYQEYYKENRRLDDKLRYERRYLNKKEEIASVSPKGFMKKS